MLYIQSRSIWKSSYSCIIPRLVIYLVFSLIHLLKAKTLLMLMILLAMLLLILYFFSILILLVIHGHLNCNVSFCLFQQYYLVRMQLLEHILRCTKAIPPL